MVPTTIQAIRQFLHTTITTIRTAIKTIAMIQPECRTLETMAKIMIITVDRPLTVHSQVSLPNTVWKDSFSIKGLHSQNVFIGANQHGNQNPNQPNSGFPTNRPNTGNQFPNQSNSGFPQPNVTPNRPNTGNQYPNQPNNGPNTGNQFPNQFNGGNQPNYNPNGGNPNQFTNQNDYRPSGPITPQTNTNQRPDVGAGGVVLAPFPGVNSNNNGGHNQYNYDNSQNRPTTNDPNNRYNSNSNGNVPLAGYSGAAHVPLA